MNNKTFNLDKEQLIKQSFALMDTHLQGTNYTQTQKLALTCRILFENGHDSGLAGQITARGEKPGTYLTQRLGIGFDEICASNLLLVNEDLEVLQGEGMANPANRFHSWLYRARPDVQCIIHTHAVHTAALSMLEVPLEIRRSFLAQVAGYTGRKRRRRDDFQSHWQQTRLTVGASWPAGCRFEY